MTFDWPLYDCFQNTLVCILHQAQLGIISYEISWLKSALEEEHNHQSKKIDLFTRKRWMMLGKYPTK